MVVLGAFNMDDRYKTPGELFLTVKNNSPSGVPLIIINILKLQRHSRIYSVLGVKLASAQKLCRPLA